MSNGLSSQLSKLVSGSGIILLGMAASRVLGFLSHIIIARSLSPNVFGAISLLVTFSTTLAALSVVGVPQGTARLISGVQESNKSQFVGAAATIGIVSSVLVTTIVVLNADLISEIFNAPIISEQRLFICLFIPAVILAKISKSILRGHTLSTPAAVSDGLLPNLIAIPVLALGIYFASAFASLFALGYWLLFQATMFASSSYFIFKNKVGIELPNKSKMKDLLTFSWPLTLHGVMFILMTYFDIITIAYFKSETLVGYYRGVLPISQTVLLLLSATSFLYMPLATTQYEAGKSNDLERFFKIATKWIATITLPILMMFLLYPDTVVIGFIGAEYEPAITPFVILSLAMYSRVLVGPNSETARAINQPKFDLKSSAIGVTANITLNILLVPQYGISGAAVATFLGYVVYNIFVNLFIYLHTGIQPLTIDLVKILSFTIIASIGLREIVGHDLSLYLIIGLGVFIEILQIAFIISASIYEPLEKEIVLSYFFNE